MAACIVCNQQTLPDDLQDVAGLASLRTRLEQVLDETVPEDAIICSSCEFDMAQIEMYYTLLAVFKKRYSETAKQRSQSLEDEPKKNLLHQTAECSSKNLQSIFEAGYVMEDSDNQIAIKPETDESTNVANLKKRETSTVHGRKRGRPRKLKKSTVSEAAGSAVSQAKYKRLRKQSSVSLKEAESDDCSLGEPGIGDSDVDDSVYEPGPSKDLRLSPSMALKDEALQSETRDLEETTVQGESKIREISNEKSEAHDLTSDERKISTPSKATVILNRKPGRPKKIQDPNQIPAKRKPVAKGKHGRPKNVEQGPRPTYPCTICNKVCIDKSRLNNHMKSHTDERPYVCSVCGNGYKDAGALNAHMKIHNNDRPFICEVCGKGFLRRLLLQRHLPAHTDARNFPCDKCGKKFKSLYHVRSHVKLHHTEGRQHLCSICGLALLTAANLKSHIKLHSEEREMPFKCSTCGKGFANKSNHMTHELIHMKKDSRETHLCSICGKGVLSASYLKIHMKQHTGELDFTCSICNSSFASQSRYHTHMSIHTGEKPHKCSECGKAFRLIYNLRLHMMSHTDERPFKCDCGQAFRQKNKLQKHMRTQKHAEFEAKAGRGQASEMPLAPPVTVPASVPIAVPQHMAAPMPVMGHMPVAAAPLPIMAPLAIANQHEMMSPYQTGPLYLGL